MTLAKTNEVGDVLWLRAVYEAGMANANGVAVSAGGDIMAAGVMANPAYNLMVGKFNALGNSCLGQSYTPFHTHPALMPADPGLAAMAGARTITQPNVVDNLELLTVTNCPAAPVSVDDPATVDASVPLALTVVSPNAGCSSAASSSRTRRRSRWCSTT